MEFSRLSQEEAAAIRAAMADPAYRETGQLDAELTRKIVAGRDARENFLQLIAWLKLLQRIGVKFEPSRKIPCTHINLL